jgi:hypothetical protein
MAFTLTITTDGAAFVDSGTEQEVARILQDVAEKLRNGYTEGSPKDYNGNTVGSWSLS